MLEVKNINVGYGNIQILWDVSLFVKTGEIIALAGSNGAGKTTLLRALSGVLKPISGKIIFMGNELSGLGTMDFVNNGIIHIPEGRELFPGMTVKDNLLLGAYSRNKKNRELAGEIERIYDLFPELKKLRNQLAGLLSGGEQQMCAIGRGLMGEAKLLLVDELSLGLAPLVVDRLIEVLNQINKQEGIAIILVEQDIQLAFSIAKRGYILNSGYIELEGDAEDLLNNEEVIKAYLGI